MVKPKIKFEVLFLVYVVIFGLSGCASTTTYKTAISKFQTASSVVIASSRSYLSEVNKVARDAYIEDCFNNRESIRLNNLYEAQPLSSQALSLRLEALDELTNYGKLLYDLATSDTPEKLQAGFRDLGTSLKKISDDVIIDANESEKEFAKSIAPISEIFGVVAKEIIEHQIQAALKRAIEAGKDQINKLILAMRDDVLVAYAQKQDFYSQQRVLLVDKYNNGLKNGESESSLRVKAENLKANLDLYEKLISANPKEGFDTMIRAHLALVEYAESPKTAKDLAAFTEAMDDFVSSAKIISGAVAALRQLKLE